MVVNVKKRHVALLFGIVPCSAWASSTQFDYWFQLISGLTDLAFIVFFVMGIFGFLRLASVYSMQVLGDKKDSLGRRDMKPMNTMKFIAGLSLCTVLVAPMGVMKLAGDVTGLGASGRPVCFVTGVSAVKTSWMMDATSCMNHVQERILSTSGFESITTEGMSYVKLFFSMLQLTAIVFFGQSVTVLLRHVFGFRNIQVSVAGAFGAMFASSVIFMLPNLTYYIQDVFMTAQPIISTTP